MIRLILFLIVFIAGLVAGAAAMQFKFAAAYWQQLPPASSKAEPRPMREHSVDPAQIHSGSPTTRGLEFSNTNGGNVRAGVWEADGPAVVDFTFAADERLYVLEGSVAVQYLGNEFTLTAGDSAIFLAGTTARWDIPDRLTKAWVIHNPGRTTRALQPLFEALGQ
jgi:uncharacterized cupin superfamily protein